MLLTKKNVLGGRGVKGFPIREENGELGYFIGYGPFECAACEHKNCISFLMALKDREELVAALHCQDKTIEKIRQIITPKVSLKTRLIKWVIGKLGEMPITVESPAFN